MKDVRIPKDELLERLRTNRDQHVATFEQGVMGYANAMLRRAQRITQEIKNGNTDIGGLFLEAYQQPRPENHTEDYDTLIDLLEMTPDEMVEMPQDEFMRYARDRWPWRDKFIGTTQMYTTAS